jgi:raffinose/stachyose/melibiose transport system permease protein
MKYQVNRKIESFIKYGLLSFVSAIFLYPVWLVLINSFKKDTELYTNLFGLPRSFQFVNYVDAWVKGKFHMYYMNSIIITAASVVFILLFATFAGFAMSRKDLIGKKLIGILFIIGITIPEQVSLMPLFLEIKGMGLYNTLLGVILIFIAFRISFASYIVTGFMNGIPPEFEEAATIDGASSFDLFARIILPLSKSSISAVAIFNIVFVWNNFWFPLIFLSSQAKKTLPVGLLAFMGQETTAFGKLFAGIMILTIPIIIIYLLLQKQFVQGVTAGAVKG